MSSEGVAAVERALDILEAFSEHNGSLSLTELATHTGFYKSTLLRLIESLEKYGYIRRTQENTYQLGAKALYLGYLYQCHFHLSEFVPQVLRRMVDEINESCSFYVREEDRRVCLHRHDARRAIRDAIHEGAQLPLHIGAAGHVMLAFSGLSGEKYDRIRDTLYATSFGERDPETAAVAAPVLGVKGELIGVLNISGPRYRIEKTPLNTLLRVLLKNASELTKQCGGNAEIFQRVLQEIG